MAKLDQINIVVGDMEAMADFYRRLGVELPAGPPEWAPHHRNAEAGDGVAHRSNWAGIVSDARTIPAQMIPCGAC
jgi:catechol 2,3-dioxygenase-like lactoylglutathione lyase family enzyme